MYCRSKAHRLWLGLLFQIGGRSAKRSMPELLSKAINIYPDIQGLLAEAMRRDLLPYDVVLTDLKMSEINELEAA
jgi:hypothetical protein